MLMKRLTEFKEVCHISELLTPWFPGDEKLEDGVLYIVDHDEQKEQYIEFNCPCGCGNVVWIPYYKLGQQKEEYPSWGFQEQNGKITLSPSILSSGFPCRSHYFIRENRIQWC